MSQKIAERLKELRGKASQADVARVVGKSAATVSNWENWENIETHSTPDAESLAKLAAHWEVSADYLVGLSDSRTGLPPDSWMVDLDYMDAIRRGDADALAPGEVGAVPIPRRLRIMSSVDYNRLRAELAPMHEALIRRMGKK